MRGERRGMSPNRTNLKRQVEKQTAMAARAFHRANEGDARAHTGRRQIAIWIVVANAAALLLSFNALTGARICDWPAFTPLVLIFTAGLAAAFLAFTSEVIFEQRVAEFYRKHGENNENAAWVQRLIIELDDDLADAAKDNDAGKVETLKRKVETAENHSREVDEGLSELTKNLDAHEWMKWASPILSGIALIFLVHGVVSSVSDPQYARAVCSYSERVTVPATGLAAHPPQRPE